jgi:hypothetical protein
MTADIAADWLVHIMASLCVLLAALNMLSDALRNFGRRRFGKGLWDSLALAGTCCVLYATVTWWPWQ